MNLKQSEVIEIASIRFDDLKSKYVTDSYSLSIKKAESVIEMLEELISMLRETE